MAHDPSSIWETPFTKLTDGDLIWLHLNARPKHPCSTHQVLSTLGLALSEARSASVNANSAVFLPLLGLFTALDQIGNTYADQAKLGAENPAWSGIKKALHHFSHINGDSDECKALYGLRNSLVHNGSIATRGRVDKSGPPRGPCHRFAFDNGIADVIQLPPSPWDGNWGAAPYTLINRDRFFQLVEEVVHNVKALLDVGTLHTRISMDELVDSFLMTVPHPKR